MPKQVVTFTTQVSLSAERKRAWDCLANIARWASWTGVFLPLALPAKPWSLGAELLVASRLNRALPRVTLRVRVIECVMGRRLVWEGSLLGVTGRHGFELDDTPDGCSLRQWEELEGSLAIWLSKLGLFEPMRKQFCRFNHELDCELGRNA
jgi:hypothetical protein